MHQLPFPSFYFFVQPFKYIRRSYPPGTHLGIIVLRMKNQLINKIDNLKMDQKRWPLWTKSNADFCIFDFSFHHLLLTAYSSLFTTHWFAMLRKLIFQDPDFSFANGRFQIVCTGNSWIARTPLTRTKQIVSATKGTFKWRSLLEADKFFKKLNADGSYQKLR